jgi:hypothetical protein
MARSAPGPMIGAAIDQHLAGGVVFEAADDAQQRRLAAAGGADEGDELVVGDVEADVLQRLDR